MVAWSPAPATTHAPGHALPAAYPLLDWLRFVLASVVVLGHSVVIPWEPAPYLAVQIFFALSGWLIGTILFRSTAKDVHSVVSPLLIAPKVPRDRRFIFAGMGDRMATPSQAKRLWAHWEEPSTCWYAGNHVGYLWSGAVRAFLTNGLRSTGFVDPAEAAS